MIKAHFIHTCKYLKKTKAILSSQATFYSVDNPESSPTLSVHLKPEMDLAGSEAITWTLKWNSRNKVPDDSNGKAGFRDTGLTSTGGICPRILSFQTMPCKVTLYTCCFTCVLVCLWVTVLWELPRQRAQALVLWKCWRIPFHPPPKKKCHLPDPSAKRGCFPTICNQSMQLNIWDFQARGRGGGGSKYSDIREGTV